MKRNSYNHHFLSSLISRTNNSFQKIKTNRNLNGKEQDLQIQDWMFDLMNKLKVHSLFKTVLQHDRHFTKTRSFHQTFPSQPQLTSAEGPYFHRKKNTVSKMNGFQLKLLLTVQVFISMTSLLTHTVAHSNRHSFRPKTNNQPLKKFLSLAVS